MPHDPRKFQIGDQVPGTKWVACGKLGEGGMGVVWEVVKPPGIRGAMKMMLLPHLSTRTEFIHRFLDEVRLLATLEHTNIVRVYDCDVVDDGTPYLVMELLHGGTLRASMRHYGRTIPADAAYDIIRGVGEGLDRAHNAGVVHRDVKPENTFLHCHQNDRPRIVLLDFGIATLMEGTRKLGEVVGTPFYMAPEQLRGERETARTDIYAMGLMLYEMLTGRLPWDFTGAGARDIAHAHLYEPPAPVCRFAAWIPRAVDRLIASALEKDPTKRPLDVFAFTSKLFELQWCKGAANPVNVNTTEPTLSTLADVSQAAAREGQPATHDTFQGMTPPPVHGRSLEIDGTPRQRRGQHLAAGETRPDEAPPFSAATRARAAMTPPAATEIPAGLPSIDRQASTARQLAATRREPTHGTEVLSTPPRSAEPSAGSASGVESTSESSTPAPTSRAVEEPSVTDPGGFPPRTPGTRRWRHRVAVFAMAILGGVAVTAIFVDRAYVRAGLPQVARPLDVEPAASAPATTALTMEVAAKGSPLTGYLTPSADAPAVVSGPVPTVGSAPQPLRPRPAAVAPTVRARPLAAPAASSGRHLTDEQRELLELVRDTP